MDNPLTTTADGNRFRFTLKFTRRENAPQDVSRLHERFEPFLENHEVGPRENYALVLAVEELVLNIAKYGASPDNGNLPLECEGEVEVNSGTIRFLVDDNGAPFDPNSSPQPPLDVPAEDRPVGGLGLHMLKQYFSPPVYRRENHRNYSVWVLERQSLPPTLPL